MTGDRLPRPEPAPSPAEARALRRLLGDWYARHRRDLPWRRTRDPYAIWISEAMLQQTRVEAVLEPYARFLARFPDVRRLAAAGEEEVVAAWSGLGYYRRARALSRAARAMVERAGGFPRSRAALLELPGVGPYTAGAVASIAFDEPAALVDGNVARVFARLFAIDAPVDRPATMRRLWALAEALVPAAPADGEPGPGDWNQALMELGALVCTPREPACGACPLAQRCAARRTGRAGLLPARSPRRAPVPVALEVLLVARAGRLLLVRRPAEGRMAGLWEPPTRELAPAGGELLWPRAFPLRLQGSALDPEPFATLSHAITHHRIRAALRRGRARAARPPSGSESREHAWVLPAEAAALGLTGLARKALRRAQPHPSPAGD